MADIDLLGITPHKVSRNLRGYSVLFYGEPKSGKTTIASRFPNHLILAFEKGYSAIPGAMAMPINSWGDFKKALRELKKPAVAEKFETIIIDTADIAYDYAEKYICAREGVDTVKDVPYGQGYAMAGKEFDESLRLIVQLGYGLVLISHSQDKTFTDEAGNETNQIVPTLGTRARNICSRLCDIIGYARPVQDPSGGLSTKLFLRSNSRFMAGSRFKYTPDWIDFSYENLVEAIAEAIDRQMVEEGAENFTDERENLYIDNTQELDFDTIMANITHTITSLQERYTEEEFLSYWAPRIREVTEKHLGIGKRIAEATRDKVEMLDLIDTELRELDVKGLPTS